MFAPPGLVGAMPLVALQRMFGQAESALKESAPDEVNSCAGKALDLQLGPRRLGFTPETFIVSFLAYTWFVGAAMAYCIMMPSQSLQDELSPLFAAENSAGKRASSARVRARSADRPVTRAAERHAAAGRACVTQQLQAAAPRTRMQ